ncbi:MAG: Dabb family protein [Oscillospiraceae bacterium]|jgi:hypothetical protein|nr:Dabb family protein [Oscillospiraceae bacterium]
MVKHIVMWSFKDELSPEERHATALKIKQGLEGLAGIVPGLLEVKVHTELIQGSTAGLLLDTLLVDADALEAYQTHPEHLKIKDIVQPATKQRLAADYEA